MARRDMPCAQLLGVALLVACGPVGGNGTSGMSVPRPVNLQPADTIRFSLSPNFTSRAQIKVNGLADFGLPDFVAQRLGSNDSSWYGVTQKGGIAVFAQHDNHLAGMVQTAHLVYRVAEHGDGEYELVRVTHKLDHFDNVHPAAHGTALDLCTAPLDSQAPLTVVDVLVMYTQAAQDAISKENEQIVSQVSSAIAQANTANAQSHVNVTFNLVDTIMTPNTEGDSGADEIASWLVEPCDMHFDDVSQKRDEYGADLAVLVAVAKGDDVGSVKDIALKATNGFAVVDYHALDTPWAFAHELGHLMGLRHNTDQANTPCPDDHGFLHTNGPNDTWADIMVNDCGDGCVTQPIWSSPDLQHDGSPMGVVNISNAARMLSAAAPIVAGYRDGVTQSVPCKAQSSARRTGKH